MFDDFLRERAERTGQPFEPFDRATDYDEYVDGLPRLDGVRGFLESRGIALPAGLPAEPPGSETGQALGKRKNELGVRLVAEDGVEPSDGSVRFVEAARQQGLGRAVVSSSMNAREVLEAAGIEHLFETIVDGAVAERAGLPGKPAPDTFLSASRALDVQPAHAAVF